MLKKWIRILTKSQKGFNQNNSSVEGKTKVTCNSRIEYKDLILGIFQYLRGFLPYGCTVCIYYQHAYSQGQWKMIFCKHVLTFKNNRQNLLFSTCYNL